jgi:hypothetical protein
MKVAPWAEELMTLVEDCEQRSERLSSWEANFIDSIKNQLIKGSRLSSRQEEILDGIWEKATLRG